MPERDLERMLPDMMQRTADMIPPSVDISAAVQQRIDASPRRPRMSPQMIGRNIMAVGSVVVVIALFGALLLHRTAPLPGNSIKGATSATATSAIIPFCVSQITHLGIPCPVKDHGISFVLLAAYADAYATSVVFGISGAPSVVNDPTLGEAELTDSHGDTLAWSHGTSGNGRDPHNIIGETDFAPLPASELHQPVSLTLTVKNIIPHNPPLPNAKPNIDGTWRIGFTITPVPGTFYRVNMAPVVQNGVGVQVQSLEFAPPAPGNLVSPDPTSATLPRGVRLLLRVTGLPTNTPLLSLLRWSSTSQIICNGMGGCPTPIVGILSIPGWTLQATGEIGAFPLMPVAPAAQPTVGPSGTVLLELLYPGQGTVQGNTATLTINNFLPETNALQTRNIYGLTWHLTLPLSKQG